MSEDTDKKTILYRGAELTPEDQEKIAEEKAAHEDDVSHVQYRGAEDDIQPNKPREKHIEHVQYRGAEDDVEM